MADADLELIAGDTEPITWTLGVTGVSNLDDVSSAALYARKQGASTNHVDGATVTVSDSAAKEVSFDPVGNGPSGNNAFDTGDEGDYDVYTMVTWSDGDTTRHPNDDKRHWKIHPNFES